MRTRLRSLEQLMPFGTAGELIAEKRQPVVSVSPDATALAALAEMEQKDIAFLPILEGEKLVGVVSEREIARGVLLQQRGNPRREAVAGKDLRCVSWRPAAMSVRRADMIIIRESPARRAQPRANPARD